MKKMALVGGGSVRTIYFIQSLIKFADRLHIGRISIMDNDPEKLRIFGGLSRYIVKKEGSSLEVELTDDIASAAAGADYVVTTLRVGQDAQRCVDERIALDRGLIGQETTGAGGFSYAIRTIPTILEYMRVIKEKSNNAVVFNFTNPSGLVTQAIYDAGYENVIGICDNATGIKIDLSNALQINASEMIVKVYGLNHLSWANQVEINGVDILPKLMRNDRFVESFHQFAYFDRDLVRKLGEIPNGYLYYFYHRERALKNMLASPLTRGESIKQINDKMLSELSRIDVEKEPERALSVYQYYMRRREGSYMSIEMGGSCSQAEPFDPKALGIGELLGHRPFTEVYEGYAGVAVNYIESLNGNGEIDLAVSVPNRGAVEGLADDDVVEVTCTVDKEGARPMRFRNIPESNMLLIQTIKRYERLTAEASRQKSKELAVEALTIHPLVNSYSLAKELVDDYCRANAPWIGEWK